MEFLIAVGPNISRLDITDDVLAAAPVFNRVQGGLQSRQARDLLLLATHWEDPPRELITTLWDGHGAELPATRSTSSY